MFSSYNHNSVGRVTRSSTGIILLNIDFSFKSDGISIKFDDYLFFIDDNFLSKTTNILVKIDINLMKLHKKVKPRVSPSELILVIFTSKITYVKCESTVFPK